MFLGRCVAALAGDRKKFGWTSESTSSWELGSRCVHRATPAVGAPNWIAAFQGFIDSMPGFRKAFERGSGWQALVLKRRTEAVWWAVVGSRPT